MRTVPLTATPGFTIKPKHVIKKDTADYIFNKSEQHIYLVNNSHFRAKNKMLSLPVVSTGHPRDMERISNEMISTSGTIWDIVEHFIDGAVLAFPNATTPATIYRRICDHLTAHLNAMRRDKMYRPPHLDDFRHMAEFGERIRQVALNIDFDFENEVPDDHILQMLPMRPVFSMSTDEEVIENKPKTVAESTRTMDVIERYMEDRRGR